MAAPAAPTRAASAPIRLAMWTGRGTSRDGRDGQQGDRLGTAATGVGVERAAVQLRALAGTAEGHAMQRDELDALLALATTGTAQLFELQRAALGQ